MKKLIPFLLLFLSACSQNPSTFKQVNANEAISMMNELEHYTILDVRTLDEYNSGHVKDAINIPNEVIEEEAEAILTDKNETIFVYCRSGNRSKQASSKLAKLGYTNIIEFGGVNTWPNELVKD